MIQNSASTFRRRRESAETSSRDTPRSSRSTEGPEEEQNDEQMDTVGSGGMKRKAEDNQETESMEVMDCMCENTNDVHTVQEDDMLEKYKADDCMEETTRNWARMTEEEHTQNRRLSTTT